MSALSVPHPLASAALASPDRLAIEADDGQRSFRQLREVVAEKAGWLLERGAKPGRVVALVGEPSLEWVEAFFAITWTGAIAAPIDPRAPRTAQDALIARLEAAIVVAPGELERRTAVPERFWPLEETRLVLSTSGSTGAPALVRLTTAQLIFSAFGSALRLGHHRDDRWLLCLPLHHVGGLSILIRASLGATPVTLHGRYSARRAAEALDSGAITLVSLVPAMLSSILDARDAAPFPPRLRAILLGGDQAPAELVERARALGAPLALTWGMTETASQVATLLDAAGFQGTEAGPPLAFARVSADAEGGLVVEGPIAPGGRLETRDRGRVRADGQVEVHGRRDLVFITGGENVDPAAVERALLTHASVKDALVLALSDPRLGSVPAALLVARGGDRPTAEDLARDLAPLIPRHERPRRIAWVEAIPRSATGKISRDAARRLFLEEERS